METWIRHLRSSSWTLLRRLQSQFDLPWVVGGDFNEVLVQSEKFGGQDINYSSVASFRETIDDCRLLDLGFEGPSFTWRKSTNNLNNIMERLDRYLGTRCWMEAFECFKVQNLDFYGSDHRAIILHTDFRQSLKKSMYGRSPLFRFEPLWMVTDSFSEVLQSSWHTNQLSATSFKEKLKLCGADLRKWSVYEFGNIRRRVEDLQSELTGLNKAHPSCLDTDRIKKVELDLERALSYEEYYWRQRSRGIGLKEGTGIQNIFI
ncbi:hypothetical protein DH2020_030739 [Rehmannia glutinosa]|uniref:Endonuclease/exonuclease/phosphatase domain-containing protein n=1 Tax=Rehmannia glutinosa TaxID=99300 RepID=A0ABR0VME7_REHGL